MKFLDFAILFLFFIALSLGIFIAFIITSDDSVYEGLSTTKQNTLSFPDSQSFEVQQFYPNIRFPERDISYALDPSCDGKKEASMLTAFSIISSKTVLRFSLLQDGKQPRIRILCSDIAPEADEKRHFVAGEGGPSELVNVSNFHVIMESKISLYRVDKCPAPQIALHELLHALGFNHTSNPESIMYPVSSCDQEIDESVLQEINRLYSIPSAPDLVVDSVSASRVGNMLSFQANISNRGLKTTKSANLSIYSEGKFLKSFSLTEFPLLLGTTKILTVRNLGVSRSSDTFEFYVESFDPDSEIRVDNNRLEITLQREA
jgi:hypothetical protein